MCLLCTFNFLVCGWTIQMKPLLYDSGSTYALYHWFFSIRVRSYLFFDQFWSENWYLFDLFYFAHRQCFGEGLNWAGCTLIALLGQENRFEALDFCYHIVKVYAVDARDEVIGGVVSTCTPVEAGGGGGDPVLRILSVGGDRMWAKSKTQKTPWTKKLTPNKSHGEFPILVLYLVTLFAELRGRNTRALSRIFGFFNTPKVPP